ncbi:efflux RND transporter periplasmic adaptor subunit [Rubritalea spongiae]|uniref:Efflux RND transporter periplasmic adaptor subunit n=1 Tax=Rubritalea spongiae TaxID=430797 RepID=A0ABW5E5P8_9BACT
MSLDLLTKKGETQEGKAKRSYAWMLPVGLLVGFVLILALLFGDRMLPAIEVDTMPVETLRSEDQGGVQFAQNSGGKGEMLFQASGWVEPDPYITYVPALVNGIIDKVHVLEGDTVEKGQLLAELISDEQELVYQAAEKKYESMQKKIDAHCMAVPIINAQIEAAKKKIEAGTALLSQERDNLQRLENIGSNAVSEQSIVAARFTVTRHEAVVAQAQAELPELEAKIEQIHAEQGSMEATLKEYEVMKAEAKLALDRTKVYAPMDAVVLHLHAAPGKKRMLNMDDPTSAVIVELYDPQKLQARIDVPLTEAAGLVVGQEVEMVSDLLANKVFKGTVTRISGQADLQRNTLQAKVAIQDPDIRLRPDMLVRAKFFALTATTKKVESGVSSGRLSLYVPQQAVFDENQVWVLSPEGRAELRRIELGSSTRDDHQLVISGLKSGEQVILPPHTDLAEGVRVKTNQ